MDRAPATSAELALSAPESDVPNGAWTWFTDERAIIDADAGSDGPRILVGTVTAEDGPGGGDIDVLWYDVGSEETGHFRLHEALEQDDHDGPALYVRPDGRYLAMYAKHGTDPYTRWRVSTRPHDPTSWEPELTLDNGSGTTYCNVYHLPGDSGGAGRTYCFTRSVNWDPNALVSTDNGSSWSCGGRLVTFGDDSQRPYVRYASDGGRIHFVTTEDHPRQWDNGVYHGFVRDGMVFDSSGRTVNHSVLDGIEGAPAPSDLTAVVKPERGTADARMTRAWTVDLVVDEDGTPVTLFQARAEDDPNDHRFFYARFDGTAWRIHHVARAGHPLYDAELDYTGLAAIDPTDPGRIVISTPVDPRRNTPLEYRELFTGVTEDGGRSWNWTPITPDASADNVRPLIPAGSDGSIALVWMRGRYHTYRKWETQVFVMPGLP